MKPEKIIKALADEQIPDLREDPNMLVADTGVFTTATSATPVSVTAAEYIEDVYEHIMSYAGQGKFIYEKFEDLRPYHHDIIRGIIYRSIKNDDRFSNPTHPNYTFIPDKHPQYWKEAKVLYENGLL